MKEKAETTRKARDDKSKAEDETVKRTRAWAKAGVKDQAKIARIAAENTREGRVVGLGEGKGKSQRCSEGSGGG